MDAPLKTPESTQDAIGAFHAAHGSGLFDAPPPTRLNFLSLGAGVQSSVLALMAARGEVSPVPDAAIFADTHAEPAAVYRWLDWLEKQLPYPVRRVSAGSLTEESLRVRTSQKSGEKYIGHMIPAYTLVVLEKWMCSNCGTPATNQAVTCDECGWNKFHVGRFNENGTLFRQCTDKHKLTPLKREVDKLRAGEPATVWIGISWDEIQRMKESVRKGVQHRWPLIERRITRQKCVEWMEANGYPTPPRSACTYCPYHSDREWRRLRDTDPESWADAISYEKRLQDAAAQVPRLSGVPYLHPQRVPLEQVNLTDYDENQGQLWNTMQNECAGMCGV